MINLDFFKSKSSRTLRLLCVLEVLVEQLKQNIDSQLINGIEADIAAASKVTLVEEYTK